MGAPEDVKVAVVGHYGTFNLGDEAIIASVLGSLRALSPEAELVGFSMNPADTRSRH